MKNKRQFGGEGEDIACNYLEKEGYKILKRNWYFGHGEIDIIAEKNKMLVFVEVKLRKTLEYGAPELAVTKKKQQQLKRMAEAYLYINEISDTDCRIDVISIFKPDKDHPEINHIENAF